MNDSIKEAMTDLLRQQETILLEQLGDLVKRGLLVIESTQPVIVQSQSVHKLELRQAVRLVLKDKEFIQELERENAELKRRLATINSAVNEKEP